MFFVVWFGRIKEMEREGKELEKKLQGSEVHRKDVEYPLGEIEELGNMLIEKEKMESNLHGRIKDLEKKLQEKVAERNNWKSHSRKKTGT
jgi:hypothetical protein